VRGRREVEGGNVDTEGFDRGGGDGPGCREDAAPAGCRTLRYDGLVREEAGVIFVRDDLRNRLSTEVGRGEQVYDLSFLTVEVVPVSHHVSGDRALVNARLAQLRQTKPGTRHSQTASACLGNPRRTSTQNALLRRPRQSCPPRASPRSAAPPHSRPVCRPPIIQSLLRL